MIVYPSIFCCAELKLAFKSRLTWKVADTLHYVLCQTELMSSTQYVSNNVSERCETAYMYHLMFRGPIFNPVCVTRNGYILFYSIHDQ